MARQQVFGNRSRVIVDIYDEKARRVFVQFADADAKKRAQKVYGVAYATAPDKSGFLKSQLRVERSRDVGRYSAGWSVTSNAPYSLFVIKGTRPHTITGSGKDGVLAFFWPKIGANVVFRSVQHPGTKANNFLSRALRAAR